MNILRFFPLLFGIFLAGCQYPKNNSDNNVSADSVRTEIIDYTFLKEESFPLEDMPHYDLVSPNPNLDLLAYKHQLQAYRVYSHSYFWGMEQLGDKGGSYMYFWCESCYKPNDTSIIAIMDLIYDV